MSSNGLPQSLAWLKEVERLQRSIVSDGFDQTLDIIQGLVGDDLVRHKFPSGSEAFTWIVPPRWSVRSAKIMAQGQTLVDANDHPMHLVTNSVPFNGTVSREELLSHHLHTDPTRPEVIPYVFKFYDPQWGFCVPHNWLNKFTADQYEVIVDTELSDDGELQIGEFTLKGKSSSTIVLPAHLDHPGQIDDGLSGAAALIELIRHFGGTKTYDGYYTLTFLFTPETIGSICYLSRFESKANSQFEACIAPNVLGNQQPLAFAESFSKDTQLDRAAQSVFSARYDRFERKSFLYLIAQDEQVFDGPGFLIPSLAIARFPYDAYHSNLDCVGAFDPEQFDESVSVIRDIIELLNRNRVPLPKYKNIPFLSRYGLWFEWCEIPEQRNKLENFLRIMDGQHSLLDLQAESKLPLHMCEQFLQTMDEHGLIEFFPPPPIKLGLKKSF